jgi:dynein assembly factor 3
MASVAKSIGHHGHWGFSRGFDLLEAYYGTTLKHDFTQNEEEINILLLQPGDIRHILHIFSKRRFYVKHGKLIKINIFIYESPIEVLSRNLLLFEVAIDFELHIRQRANIFLEIFGNLKIQKRTNDYIKQIAYRLNKYKETNKNTIIDLSYLKYREIDDLDRVFKLYSTSTTAATSTTPSIDIETLFNHRQRGLYEDRFDSRKALYDWDYQNSIRTRASIIHIKQYKEWRHTGIAFEFGDQVYNEANKTLLSYTEGVLKNGKEKGFKKEVFFFFFF